MKVREASTTANGKRLAKEVARQEAEIADLKRQLTEALERISIGAGVGRGTQELGHFFQTAVERHRQAEKAARQGREEAEARQPAGAPAENRAEQDVQPEQSANLFVRDALYGDRGRGQPGVLEHVGKPGDDQDHADEAEIVGRQQTGEDHHASKSQSEPDPLAGHARHTAADGFPA